MQTSKFPAQRANSSANTSCNGAQGAPMRVTQDRPWSDAATAVAKASRSTWRNASDQTAWPISCSTMNRWDGTVPSSVPWGRWIVHGRPALGSGCEQASPTTHRLVKGSMATAPSTRSSTCRAAGTAAAMSAATFARSSGESPVNVHVPAGVRITGASEPDAPEADGAANSVAAPNKAAAANTAMAAIRAVGARRCMPPTVDSGGQGPLNAGSTPAGNRYGGRVLSFRLLGPFAVERDGVALALGSPRQRALLALLALHAGETLSVDRLVDELWGETAPKTAAHVVQVYVSHLRQVLAARPGEPAIETRGAGYALVAPADAFDLARFE